MKVEIENHSKIDKSFYIYGKYFALKVDYDDVNHAEVDAAAETLKEIIEENWDEDKFKERYKKEITKNWVEDKYLREDYNNDINEYFNSYNI